MIPSHRHSLNEAAQGRYDLLVLGGGINGAGVARDAAMRGLKVLLLERRDFGFGASSKSTKLAHGGLRYLESLELSLVRESLKERGLLHEFLAPHLVEAQPFLLPHYRGMERPPWLVGLGLWLYDALALGATIGRHHSLSLAQALELEPALAHPDLGGASLYYDCRMNDARLVLENVLDAERHGARCLNYCEVLAAPQLLDGDVRLKVRDLEAEEEAEVRGSLLVNASGAWTDRALESLGRPAPRPLLKPTKGVHLLTREPLTRGRALLVQVSGEKRVIFVIPFRFGGKERSLVGTTDTDYRGDPDEVSGTPEDSAYLLAQLKRTFPSLSLGASGILSSYAGLRPLAAPSMDSHNSAISRESQILEEGGLVTMFGGKFTTYRRFAEQAVDLALKRLHLQPRPCLSAAKPLPGAPKDLAEQEWLAEGREGGGGYLKRLYGMPAKAVMKIAEEEGLAAPLAPGSEGILAQAVYAARHEKAARLQDFYLRRTFLGLELDGGHEGVDKVAARMGKELGWSRDREREELEDLEKTLAREFR